MNVHRARALVSLVIAVAVAAALAVQPASGQAPGGRPAGATATFSPASVTGSGTSTPKVS
jgi:hypothetical protein